jgi:hypothetical protein
MFGLSAAVFELSYSWVFATLQSVASSLGFLLPLAGKPPHPISLRLSCGPFESTDYSTADLNLAALQVWVQASPPCGVMFGWDFAQAVCDAWSLFFGLRAEPRVCPL